MGAFYKFLEKYHMEKWFRKDNLIVMVLAGILLAVIALPTKEANNKEEERQTMLQLESEVGTVKSEMRTTSYEAPKEPAENQEDTLEYVSKLERKLEELLSKIEGAGEVYVMISLQESEEFVVEKDTIIKTIYPKVEGVAVIAEGAGTGRVTQHIIEVVQVLFDLELHKVKVTGS